MLATQGNGVFAAGLLLAAMGAASAQDRPALDSPTPASQTSAAAERRPAPHLVLSSPEWNFGQIWYGDPCRTEIELKNVGDAPLEIIRVKSSCGCTVAQPKKKELAPGEADTLTVRYNSTKRAKKVTQTITIESNDPAHPQIRFPVRGEVWHVFDATPLMAIFGMVKPSSEKSVTIELRNNLPEKVHPELIPLRPDEHFDLELVEVEPGMRYRLIARTKPPLKPGINRTSAVLLTGVERLPKMIVPVTAVALRPVEVRPDRVWLTSAHPNATTRMLSLYYSEDRPVEITELKASHPSVGVRQLPARRKPNERCEFAACQIQVTLPPYADFPDEDVRVEIHTSDPDPEFQTLGVTISKQRLRQPTTRKVSRNPVQRVSPGGKLIPLRGSESQKPGRKPE